MSKKAREAPGSEVSEISVHLKPVLGVRPGVYLSVLYGVALLIVLFFLLFYPGIRYRGSYLSLTTFPGRATVKIDGSYAGSTPCTIFLKRGTREIEISKPYYSPVSLKRIVNGRIFGTLFLKDLKNEKYSLTVTDLQGLMDWSLLDFEKNPDISKTLSEAAWAAVDNTSKQEMYVFLDNAMKFITSEDQIKELILAGSRVSTESSLLTSTNFQSIVLNMIQIKQKYDNLPFWLILSLSRAKANKLAQSEWVKQHALEYREKAAKYYLANFSTPKSYQGTASTINIAGILFRSIPAGDLVQGDDSDPESFGTTITQSLPHPVSIDPFYLSETEVSNLQFQAFIKENPEWGPGNRDFLVQKGLVTDSYLSEWTGGKVPAGREDHPVVSVSFHAAEAYCEWLTPRVRAALPGYTARLPSEAQWEWAARGGLRGMPYPLGEKPGKSVFFVKGITGPAKVGSSEPNGYGLRDMTGNVWEWCRTPFAPSSYLLSSLDPGRNALLEAALVNIPSSERVVRGGSWNNEPELIKVSTRGFQPADWCTQYLGFRVALVRP